MEPILLLKTWQAEIRILTKDRHDRFWTACELTRLEVKLYDSRFFEVTSEWMHSYRKLMLSTCFQTQLKCAIDPALAQETGFYYS